MFMFLQGDDKLDNRIALLTSGCLPRLFQLACRGTNMTRELSLEVAEVKHKQSQFVSDHSIPLSALSRCTH